MNDVRIEVALAGMDLLAAGSASTDFSAFGLHQDQVDLFTGPQYWLAPDRPSVEDISNKLVWGVLDSIGVPRFAVPAEYIAAVICAFVHPCNTLTAANWLSQHYSAGDLAEGVNELTGEVVTPSKVFALVMMLEERKPADFMERFSKKTGKVIRNGQEIQAKASK